CNLRKDYRDFKITRITKLMLSNQTFEEHKNYNLYAYYEHLAKSSDLEQVKVLFTKSVVTEMGSQKFYHGLIVENETVDGVEMVFATNSLEYIGKWLLTFTSKVEIISPPELKRLMEQLAKEIAEKYL
ncbi:MAG: WYL domain-containing protein, partial [Bacteroidales bacterium]|nr:WYL domain-containing protein [Bacteroidales bacterium]